MKRCSTAADRRHLANVAALGCVVCRYCYGHADTPAEVHHVRVLHGWGRSSHTATIPLCYEHHRGNTGVHSMGRQPFTDLHGKSEIDLLNIVNIQLKATAWN